MKQNFLWSNSMYSNKRFDCSRNIVRNLIKVLVVGLYGEFKDRESG